jgi:hypothetical protein
MPADDGYLLKGTYNDYLSQVVPESLKVPTSFNLENPARGSNSNIGVK